MKNVTLTESLIDVLYTPNSHATIGAWKSCHGGIKENISALALLFTPGITTRNIVPRTLLR